MKKHEKKYGACGNNTCGVSIDVKVNLERGRGGHVTYMIAAR